MKRMINYEWSNIRAQSKVDWAMHSAAFTATWIQFPKLSQFLLKHINTILLRKAYNAFKASPSLFHHQICNRFIYVFITWPLHSYTILFFFISICMKHYPISVLHNWQRVPNPNGDRTILRTPPFFFKFCPTLSNPTLFVALLLWLNVPSCYI